MQQVKGKAHSRNQPQDQVDHGGYSPSLA